MSRSKAQICQRTSTAQTFCIRKLSQIVVTFDRIAASSPFFVTFIKRDLLMTPTLLCTCPDGESEMKMKK